MTSLCGTPIFATAGRATKLDACGKPMTGTANAAVTAGLISTEIKPQTQGGQETIITNGAGKICVAVKTPEQLKWNEVTITLCNVDPELIALLTGDTLVLDDTPVTPKAVGLQQRRSTYATGRFGWETWTATDGMGCATVAATSVPWLGYSLLPYVVEGRLGDLTFNNDGEQQQLGHRPVLCAQHLCWCRLQAADGNSDRHSPPLPVGQPGRADRPVRHYRGSLIRHRPGEPGAVHLSAPGSRAERARG